jgi:hypothetical protein
MKYVTNRNQLADSRSIFPLGRKELRKSAAVFEKRDRATKAPAFGGLDFRCIFDNGCTQL